MACGVRHVRSAQENYRTFYFIKAPHTHTLAAACVHIVLDMACAAYGPCLRTAQPYCAHYVPHSRTFTSSELTFEKLFPHRQKCVICLSFRCRTNVPGIKRLAVLRRTKNFVLQLIYYEIAIIFTFT